MKKLGFLILISFFLISCWRQEMEQSIEKTASWTTSQTNVQNFTIWVMWGGMSPTINNRETVNIDSTYYGSHKPVYWDIALIKISNEQKVIKRIIALPGDTLKFESGAVLMKKSDGSSFSTLKEDFLSEFSNGKTFLPYVEKETEFLVPENAYFVMWDNRTNSSDSRSCFLSCTLPEARSRFVSVSEILGKVTK